MRMLPVLVLLHALAAVSYGKPDGAPKSACGSLAPAHSGILPQRNAPPYTVSAVKMENNKVKVTITSSIGEEFEGFALQARQSRDMNQMVEGKFTERNGVSKTIDCFRGRQNTLTQVNPSPKREIVTEWTPDNGYSGDVVFRATVAKTFAIFWVEVDSRPVKIRGSPNSSPSSRERNDPNRMYDECFVTKGCFGYPTGCVTRGDCEVLLSYVNNVNGVTFEMKGYLEPQTYMAMGLSTDARMGEDKVTECGRQGSTILVKESWNAGQTNGRTRELPSNSYNSDFTNGLTTCSWTARYLTETEGRRFDLENSTYHVLLAKGPMSNGRIGYHSGKIASQEPVNFTAFELIRGEGVSDSIKIHGTFMITAWVGLVSLGILLARHFKTAWETRTVCGVKIWFALHRGLMIVALIFVVIAFIVIFVYKNGWNYETKNPHAVLGCIATALGLFQPIMALFRPAPDNPKRPVFNWLHWIVGNAAQIIAVITIFFAVSLETSGLKESFYWVMAIFVIVHLLFHFLFQVHAWTAGKKKNNEVKMVEMSSGRGANNIQNNVQEKNLSENVFRVLLLGIYAIFLVVIILALYALVGVA